MMNDLETPDADVLIFINKLLINLSCIGSAWLISIEVCKNIDSWWRWPMGLGIALLSAYLLRALALLPIVVMEAILRGSDQLALLQLQVSEMRKELDQGAKTLD